MINLKRKEELEKDMKKIMAQEEIDEYREFIEDQQDYIRSLVAENEKLRIYILDKAIQAIIV